MPPSNASANSLNTTRWYSASLSILAAWNSFLGGSLEACGQQVLDVEVVVARPDRVHRRQRDVLVGTTIAGDEVVEQIDEGIGVEQQCMAAAHEVAGQRCAPCRR